MRTHITQRAYQELLAHLREVDKLQEKTEKIEQRVRRLLGCGEKDGQTANDRIFGLVYNGEDVGETLTLIGVEVAE